MDWMKIAGYTIYGIGIVGGVEGAFKGNRPISIMAIGVIVLGSVLLGMKK
jgi:hypothetical protein